MKIPIWIVAIAHRHGTDLSAACTEEKADEIVKVYVDEWWDHEMSREKKKPKPKDSAKMVRDYFKFVENESFIIEKSELEMEPGYG